MFLHLVGDEKFTDSAYESFEEVAKGQNRFIRIADNNLPIVHAVNTPLETMSTESVVQLVGDQSKNVEGLIIHCLGLESREVLYWAKRTPTAWIGWGGDYQHLISGEEPVLPKTLALLEETHFPTIERLRKMKLKRNLKYVYQWGAALKAIESLRQRALNCRIGPKSKLEPSLLSKIDYFSPVTIDEYELVRKRVPWFKAEYLRWNYSYQIQRMLDLTGRTRLCGSNILIGNSSTPTCNHVEAIDELASCGIPDCTRVFCPLNYGDTSYGDAVEKYGHKKLGNAFVPIRDFLSLQEYTSVLLTCRLLIMNHTRQQALGNIAVCLISGGTVAMRQESPLYAFLKRVGGNVVPIQQLGYYLGNSESQITNAENSISSVQKYFSRESANEATRNLLRSLKSKQHLFI